MKHWQALGSVTKTPDTHSDEIGLQLRRTDINATTTARCTSEFGVEFVWRAVTFDRMRDALRMFVRNGGGMESVIYRRILGHEVEEQTLAVKLPKKYALRMVTCR